MEKKSLLWDRLDNAALIFPASHRKTWSNVFRVSFTMKDMVDPDILQQAVNNTAPRFPTICARLCKSTFWFYLEQLSEPPAVKQDSYQPVRHMSREEFSTCAVRILYYRNRFAVEFFHALTDGTGGMIFGKTLAAEYVRLFYGENVPCEYGIKNIHDSVPASELNDSFKDFKGPVSAPRDSLDVYRPEDGIESERFLHDTLGILESAQLISASKNAGVTVTAYLTAILIESLLEMQAEDIPQRRKRKKIKIQIPVNLRQMYGSDTMRNFVAVTNIGVDPRLGEYTFEELLKIVSLQMQLTITEKNMQTIFTPNVSAEMNPLIKIVPLPLKNLIMRMVFDRVGENVSCLSISNLGNVKLPENMSRHLDRVEFIIGAQTNGTYNCGVSSFEEKAFVHLVRVTKEPRLERLFFSKLVKLGLHVKIESNDR